MLSALLAWKILATKFQYYIIFLWTLSTAYRSDKRFRVYLTLEFVIFRLSSSSLNLQSNLLPCNFESVFVQIRDLPRFPTIFICRAVLMCALFYRDLPILWHFCDIIEFNSGKENWIPPLFSCQKNEEFVPKEPCDSVIRSAIKSSFAR